MIKSRLKKDIYAGCFCLPDQSQSSFSDPIAVCVKALIPREQTQIWQRPRRSKTSHFML